MFAHICEALIESSVGQVCLLFSAVEEGRLRQEATELELVKEMSHLLSSEHVRGKALSVSLSAIARQTH